MKLPLLFVSLLTTIFGFSQEISKIKLISTIEFEKLAEFENDYCIVAENYKLKGDLSSDSNHYYTDIAYRFSKECTNTEIKTSIVFNLAKAYTKIGENKTAQGYYEIALNGFFQQKDTNSIAKTYKSMGVNYKRMTRFSEAIESFNLATQYFLITNDKAGIALIELNIGLLHKNMNRFEEAKKKYHNALKLFSELNEYELIADCQNNLGNVFKNEHNIDSAFYYMYLTLESRKKHGAERKLSFIYHNLANLHLQINQLDSAVFYIESSISIKKKLGNVGDLTSDYTVYADIYSKKNNYQKAIWALEKAREYSIETSQTSFNDGIALGLAKTYYKIGNTKKSAENFIIHFQQLDALQLKNDPLNIGQKLFLYEYLRDSIETEKLVLENELQEAKQKNYLLSNRSLNYKLYFISSIVGLLVLMIVLLYIAFKKRLKQTKEHRNILALQNNELKKTLVSKEEKETLLKEIHHRVKNNLQIISSLIRLQSGYINKHNYIERLNEIENRIMCMALVHEKLYQSSNLSKLEVKSYVRELSINILESYQPEKHVKFNFNIDPGEFVIDTLIPLGLILNETISNALKHAFYDQDEGVISISMNKNAEQTVLTIKDSGIGADLSIEELKEDSLGMDLIFSLTEQLDGELDIDTSNGFKYTFTFPNLK